LKGFLLKQYIGMY